MSDRNLRESQYDIGQLSDLAGSFREKLARIKNASSLAGLSYNGWYPYDSLSCFSTLNALLRGENRALLELADGEAILEIGCADADVSFFLESLGHEVHAVDNPATNFNNLAGVETMRKALDSKLVLTPMDLDSQFVLPQSQYAMALFLGVLYHLKNPMYAMERLAEACRYCVLSTKIIEDDRPVAYLSGDREINDDSTNYWIFSRAGLHRLAERTGWIVCEGMDVRVNRGDLRHWALLKSHWSDSVPRIWLVDGWHAIEHRSWRWTERVFSIRLNGDRSSLPALDFEFHIAPATIEHFGKVELKAAANGVPIGSQSYDSPGPNRFRSSSIPFDCLKDGAAIVVRFELDKALPPHSFDGRELGVMVAFSPKELSEGRYQPFLTL